MTGIDWHLVKRLHLKASQALHRAVKAEGCGQGQAARADWSRGFRLARRAAEIMKGSDVEPQRSQIMALAAFMAFKCGENEESLLWIERALQGNPQDEHLVRLVKLRQAVKMARVKQCA